MQTPLYESIVNSLEEILIAVDTEMAVLFVNRAGEEFIGLMSGHVVGRSLSSLFAGDRTIVPLVKKTMQEVRPVRGTDAPLGAEGQRRVDFAIAPLVDRGAVAGAVLLLRARPDFFKKGDEQFDSIMYLLSSVAHEIKNPLAGIKGAAQLLRKKASEEGSRSLDIIIREAGRLDEIVKGYLFIGRKPVFNRINLHEVIEEAVNVLGAELKAGKVVLKRLYDPSLPVIKGDEGKLLQVFINIVKNAREAMPKGGTLEIRTRPAFEYIIEKKKKVKMKFAVAGFTDNGVGIAYEEFEKVFMPFYTGKKEGTGLGLAISRKIVHDHGGLIKIKAAPGRGAEVDIYLPFAGSG